MFKNSLICIYLFFIFRSKENFYYFKFNLQGRYGEPSIRRAVPLAIALTSVSNPEMSIIDILNKYSHDSDIEVAQNAIFCMGLVGAGTNNAR